MSHAETLLESRVFRVIRKTMRSGDGREVVRDIVHHPGAVAILPVLADDRVVMIRNFRAAAGERLWEIPAGTLEPGEAPLDTARRELVEETGYSGEQFRPLTTFYSSPGFLDETMHLFLATDLTPGPQKLEAGEDILVETRSRHELLEMLFGGEIRDAKTLVAVLYWEALRHRT